jgi:hypothetical protein
MRDCFEYCNFCNAGTFMKVKDYKKESVGELLIETTTKEDKCKHCGRLIHIINIKATEEKPSV